MVGMNEKNLDLQFRKGCRCVNPVICPNCGHVIPPCPHFRECLSAVKHLIGEIREYEEESQPMEEFRKKLDKIVEDPLNLLFAYGGALLAEWIKKNYLPRKFRKRK
ncbi:hypothetical protein DRP04_01885 [Archaeoglobales archaeon]|nr:MAG: hypothetical protein DRP04_01885 [Archaeoglobales archaeon]